MSHFGRFRIKSWDRKSGLGLGILGLDLPDWPQSPWHWPQSHSDWGRTCQYWGQAWGRPARTEGRPLRMPGLRAGMLGLRAGLPRLRADLPGLRAGMSRLRAGLPGLRAGLSGLRAGLPVLRIGLPGLRAGLSGLRAGLPVTLNMLLLVFGDLFPFTSAPMFRDKPLLYCEYKVTGPTGGDMPLSGFELQRNYDGNPVGMGAGVRPAPSLDRRSAATVATSQARPARTRRGAPPRRASALRAPQGSCTNAAVCASFRSPTCRGTRR